MNSKCDHCGEFAVDNSENIVVCKSCGIVVEDSVIATEECTAAVVKHFTPYNRSEARLHNRKRATTSFLHGQRVLDNLYHVNNISVTLKSQVNELFKLVTSVKRFSKKEDAGAAAACSLFLFLRKNKQAICIKTLCSQVPCTKSKFSFFLKFIKSHLSSDEKFKQFSFVLDDNASDGLKKDEEDVPDSIDSLIREICEKAESEEKSELMKKAASLAKLAYSCWLFTGRSPRSVVVASTFLSWKSMHPMRRKASYAEFCRQFEVRESQAKHRIPELKDLLLKLGEMIPSHTKNYVNEDNVLFHLNTILEHSETLRNDLFPDSYTCKEVDTVEFSNFRTPPIKSHPRVEPSDAVHYDSDMNASDIEISDSEIDSYIVSDKKKKIIEFCEKNLKPT